MSSFISHIQAYSITWKTVQVEISQTDVTAQDKEVMEAHALKKTNSSGLGQINKSYGTIRKQWKNLRNVRSGSQSDTYHYLYGTIHEIGHYVLIVWH